MKSAIVLISSLLLLVLPLTAQADDDGRGVLFLTSEPIHAAVYLDGEPQPETTPLVLRNLTAGSHDIIIVKEGYLPYEGSVEIPQGGSPATYHTVLTFPFSAAESWMRRRSFSTTSPWRSVKRNLPLKSSSPPGSINSTGSLIDFLLKPAIPGSLFSGGWISPSSPHCSSPAA